jgi:hypothetical protein
LLTPRDLTGADPTHADLTGAIFVSEGGGSSGLGKATPTSGQLKRAGTDAHGAATD